MYKASNMNTTFPRFWYGSKEMEKFYGLKPGCKYEATIMWDEKQSAMIIEFEQVK